MHSAKESLGERSCEDRKVSAKNLPPEIRRLILSSLELESLKSLVKTSRLFYQQYTFDRVYILRKCLQKTLGFISIEACAVYYSGLESFTTTRGKNQVKDFLDSYVKRLSRDKASTFNGDLTNDEVIGIVKMYFSVIRPLQKHFTEWALANLAKENKIIQFCSDSDELCKPPSRSEELRMLRALYRFQLLCNLFGRGPHILKRPPTITSDFSDMLNIFFCIFEPWEVEEIGCIYFFAEQKFDQIFDAMPLDIYKETFQLQVSPTDKDTFDLDSRAARDYLLEGTISRGLELLSAVFRIHNHDVLVSEIQRNIASSSQYFYYMQYFYILAMVEDAQRKRWEDFPSDRDAKQRRLDPLPFDGDGEPDINQRPPLAWTLMWEGTYSNIFGFFLPDEFRKCGYVIWDADRIKCYGGKAIFDWYLEKSWEEWDARDTFA